MEQEIEGVEHGRHEIEDKEEGAKTRGKGYLEQGQVGHRTGASRTQNKGKGKAELRAIEMQNRL